MTDERPLLYDLFCGAGGATKGYQRAGFRVIGIDNKPQPRYCGDGFIQMNAIAFLDLYILGEFERAVAIAASPPCQGYSIMRNLPWLRDKTYVLLIEPVREALEAAGLPYVIENVAGARYRKSQPTGLKAGWLCGQMFGLPILRHRYFETNWPWMQPAHGKHWGTVRNGRTSGARARDLVTLKDGRVRTRTAKAGLPSVQTMPPSMTGGLERRFRENGARQSAVNLGHAAGFALAKEAMGISWMRREELTQAIPPVMTEWLGRELLRHLTFEIEGRGK